MPAPDIVVGLIAGFVLGALLVGEGGFVYGRRMGYKQGRHDGYKHAREIPIGTFKALSIGGIKDGDHVSLSGVIELRDDVTIER